MAAIFQIITNENNLYSLGSTCINNPLKSINIGRPVVYSNTISWQDIQFNNTEATNHAHGKNSSYSYFQNTEQVISAIAYALDETKIIRTNYESLGNTYATKTSVTNLSDALNSLVARVAALENATPTPQPTTYTVEFNANGGSVSIESQTVNDGTSITLPSYTGTRTGYTFDGWSTEEDGSGITYNANTSYTVDRDITLYAKWTKNQYTVECIVNNGSKSPNSTQTVTYDGDVYWTITPKTGYQMPTSVIGATIDGYKVKVSNVTSNTTITVNCETIPVKRYTITIHPNNGNANSVESYEENSTFEINHISNITRTGYTLLGWSTKENGSVIYNDSYGNNSFRVTGNVDLWAVWEENVQYYWYVGRQDTNGGANAIGTADWETTNYDVFINSNDKQSTTSLDAIKTALTGSVNVGAKSTGQEDVVIIAPTSVINQITSIKNASDTMILAWDKMSPSNNYTTVFIENYVLETLNIHF